MTNEAASPFDLLLEILAVSEGVSSIGPNLEFIEQQWVGVGFSVAGQNFVADMKQVGEVLTQPSLTVVPGVQPWVMGIANVRGRLVPIIDLQLFFGKEKASNVGSRRVVTVDVNDTFVGLVVDQVYGMKHFAVDDYDASAITENIVFNMAQHVTGAYKVGDEVWPLFDLEELVFNESFLNIAA